MEPARTIIDKFGGDTRVASMLGIHRTRVAAWKQPKPKGSGGLIPFRHVPRLLAVAEEQHIPLDVADFLPPKEGQP